MRRKNKPSRRHWQFSLALLALFAGGSRAAAQYVGWSLDQQDPLWSKFVPQLKYIKTDMEADLTRYDFKQPGPKSINNQRIYLATGVGIGWNFYIYHPDLLSFSILAEPGYQWDQSDGSVNSVHQENVLLNGMLTATLLGEKPYATTLNYYRAHDTYKYDFFDTAIADSESLNVSTGYREGPVPFTITFAKSTEDITSFNRETISDQLTTTLHARNERQDRDFTDFNYQFSESSYNSQFGSINSTSENTYQRVSLMDREYFAKSSLSSTLLYYTSESKNGSSDNLNLNFAYNYDHTKSLHSFYNYSLSIFSGNGADSVEHFVSAGLSHSLYESLSSSINVHGSSINSSSFDSTLDSKTYGAGGSVDYTKKLGTWGRISFGNSATYDITDQQVSGSTLFIADEAYTVPISGPMIIRLNQPRDLSIVSVKKNNIDLAPSEWSTLTASDPWQIQFFSAGPNNVQPGDAITVSYNVNSNPSGQYSVLSDGSRFSFQFWHQRAEIYARYDFTRNYTSSGGFVLQDYEQLEVGARAEWNGFRAQARYTDQHSTLYSFQSLTLSEGYSTPLSKTSSLGIDLSQQWSVYPPGSGTSTNQTQVGSFYNYTVRYDWRPSGVINFHAEAGYQQQAGLGYDQERFAARAYLNWQVGKLDFHLGIEHQQEAYTAESREEDLVFLRMRRNF